MMKIDEKIKILQFTYAGMLADAVLQMGKEDILDSVTKQKKQEQLKTGKMKAEKFGITKPEDVFLKLSEIFNCAKWEIVHKSDGFSANAKFCMLCGFAKKIGAEKPCYLYCLDPMEGMVKGLNNNRNYIVKETLWEGSKCEIDVKDTSYNNMVQD